MKELTAFCWRGDIKDISSVSLASIKIVGKYPYIHSARIRSLVLRIVLYNTDKLGPICYQLVS